MCVGNLFRSPEPPSMPAAPPPPSAPQTRPEAGSNQTTARRRQRQLAAYASTRSDRIATSSAGLQSEATTGRAQLLGQTATV